MPLQPWFNESKLGIFLHWGIYAVDGVAESWSIFTGGLTPEAYMQQLGGFTADRYDPDAWAELITDAGAGYAVLTAKHHDGVALWDTGATDLSVANRTPAGRDLVGPYAEALRRRGLKVGLYFSHSDWSHPDYPTIRPTQPQRDWLEGNRFTTPEPGAEDPAAWERYLERVHRGQIRELLDRYRPDLLWFDGQWERDERQWRMRELRNEILDRHPEIVLNGRMLGYGDYTTPEQGVPILPPEGPWELCLTIGDCWGHRPDDTRPKSARELIRTFAETIGGGGNLLLNTGPLADGTIRPDHAERLRTLGAWIRRHSEAVHSTVAGLPPGHHYGPSTLSADRRTLFLTCFDIPREHIIVRGLHNKVLRAHCLTTGQELSADTVGGFMSHGVPGVTRIQAPASTDPYATVLALELDGELDVYRGHGEG